LDFREIGRYDAEAAAREDLILFQRERDILADLFAIKLISGQTADVQGCLKKLLARRAPWLLEDNDKNEVRFENPDALYEAMMKRHYGEGWTWESAVSTET
jgi:hypothetical protein